MTGREVYLRALSLINERDSRGDFHNDTSDYEANAPDLLNIIVSQVWADDCCVRGISPKDYKYTVERITSLDTELPVHSAVAAIIPYLLASLLIHEEDMTRSEYYRRLFVSSENALLGAFTSAKHTSIADVYS
jgi:hypothetical protein